MTKENYDCPLWLPLILFASRHKLIQTVFFISNWLLSWFRSVI